MDLIALHALMTCVVMRHNQWRLSFMDLKIIVVRRNTLGYCERAIKSSFERSWFRVWLVWKSFSDERKLVAGRTIAFHMQHASLKINISRTTRNHFLTLISLIRCLLLAFLFRFRAPTRTHRRIQRRENLLLVARRTRLAPVVELAQLLAALWNFIGL